MLLYYGDFLLNQVYNINQLIVNPSNNFFKAKLFNEEVVYAVLTELNLLLFSPLEHKKSEGYLIFVCNIPQLSILHSETSGSLSLSIGLPFSNLKQINLGLKTKEEVELFEEIFSLTSEKFKDYYEIFHEDFLYKPIHSLQNNQFSESYFSELIKQPVEPIQLSSRASTHSSLSFINNSQEMTKEIINSNSIDEYISYLNYKISIFEKYVGSEPSTVILVKEIIFLYQRIIEKTSLNSDPSYESYINDFKRFIDLPKVKDKLKQL